MSGLACAFAKDLPRRRGDPRGNVRPFGVPPWGGKDRSDPRKRGTPNEGVRNEANLPWRAAMTAGRQRRPGPCGWAEGRQTKPIPRSDRSGRRRARSPVEPSLGPPVRTNPIWRRGQGWTWAGAGGGATRDDCAKRTQLAPRRTEGDAGDQGHGAGRHWGQARQTKPISGGRAPVGEGRQGRQCRRRQAQTCETKPIPSGATRSASPLWKESYGELEPQKASTKQSQFPPDRGGQGSERLPMSPAGPIVRNKANWPAPTGRGGGRRGRKCCRRWGPARQTKPILGGRPMRRPATAHHSVRGAATCPAKSVEVDSFEKERCSTCRHTQRR